MDNSHNPYNVFGARFLEAYILLRIPHHLDLVIALGNTYDDVVSFIIWGESEDQPEIIRELCAQFVHRKLENEDFCSLREIYKKWKAGSEKDLALSIDELKSSHTKRQSVAA